MFKQLFFIFAAATTLGGIYVYHEYLKDELDERNKEEKKLEKVKEAVEVERSSSNGQSSQEIKNIDCSTVEHWI